MKIALRLVCLGLALLSAALANAKVVTVTLNGLEIGIDERTGSVVLLRSTHTKEILQAEPQSAGLLDVAYPVDSFAAMRLASRFSTAAIEQSANEVTIKWNQLGASRSNLALPGGAVRAEVSFKAAADGRSVILRSRIRNDSAVPVPQILFPDLWGLKPVAGMEQTRLRFARGNAYPFAEPVNDPQKAPFYASLSHGSGIAWKEYPAGGYYQPNSLRWLDYGGYAGGLSVFQKKWGTFDWPDVFTRRSERDPQSLRMAWVHKQEIKPGAEWDSGEFWLTPHAGGWAKGIEVFNEYVKQAVPAPTLPTHVRDDIGYQTIWMIQTAEVDPAKATFRYSDLPRIAADARRYGIHEIVPWGWNTYSTLPIPIRTELGTEQELVAGVKAAKQQGVNITPFISITLVRNMYASRYGVEPANADWTYHDELVPMFRPYYTKYWNGVEIDSNNPIWQRDTTDALTQWIERGVSSFAWDVYKVHPAADGGRPPVLTLTDNVRKVARAADPQSVFSGESVSHLEFDSQTLDYLWNWNDYEDAAPITNVLRAPRVSCNVESSPLVVAKCFADNLYMNVMPRKPDDANGTALISDKPELGQAVLDASKLRRQFLRYFVDGTFIGDAVLSKPCSGFVRGYRLKDRLLVIVLNDSAAPKSIDVSSELGLWLPSAKNYRLTRYDGGGKQIGGVESTPAQWSRSFEQLPGGAFTFLEFTMN